MTAVAVGVSVAWGVGVFLNVSVLQGWVPYFRARYGDYKSVTLALLGVAVVFPYMLGVYVNCWKGIALALDSVDWLFPDPPAAGGKG